MAKYALLALIRLILLALLTTTCVTRAAPMSTTSRPYLTTTTDAKTNGHKGVQHIWSVINVANLTLLCGEKAPAAAAAAAAKAAVTAGSGDSQGSSVIPHGTMQGEAHDHQNVREQVAEQVAEQVTSRWLSFLRALKAYSVINAPHKQGGMSVAATAGDAGDPAGAASASDQGVEQEEGGTIGTGSHHVPAFLRAVRIGHLNMDFTSGAGTANMSADIWNMTAISAHPHNGHFDFSLRSAHEETHRSVELVFSPADDIHYVTNTSSTKPVVCSFTFCDVHMSVCTNLTSTTYANGSLFYTAPKPYVFTDVVASLPGESVRLTKVVCARQTLRLAEDARRPVLVFFQSKQLAQTANQYAVTGWQQLNDQEEKQLEEKRHRRSADMRQEQGGATGAAACHRETWSVGPRDLGLDGIMVMPDGRMEVGYCSGGCDLKRDNKLMPQHAIFRIHYANISARPGVRFAGDSGVIRGPDCVPTGLLQQSAIIKKNNSAFLMILLTSIKVTSCECR